MGRELTAIQILIVMVVFGLLLASIFWFYDQAIRVPRTTHLHIAPNGELAVQLGPELLFFDEDEQLSRAVDLRGLGIESDAADFAFFPDGDLLIRAGREDDNPWFNLRRYMRKENQSPTANVADSPGLLRCDLEDMDCEPFGDPPLNLNDTYHIALDDAVERVFIADASRHQLLMLDLEGNLLFRLTSGLKFPNQIIYRAPYLWVANTNHHAISVYEVLGDRLLYRADKSFSAFAPGERNNTWPTSLELVDDDLWVVNAQHDMAHGIGLRFRQDGHYLGKLRSTVNADMYNPIRMQDRVLITDTETSQILRYALDGELLDDFAPAELVRRVSRYNEHEQHYYHLIYWMIGIFVVAIAVGIGVGIYQGNEDYQASPPPSAAESAVDVDSAEIRWLAVNSRLQRQVRVMIWIIPALLIVTAWLAWPVAYKLPTDMKWVMGILLLLTGYALRGIQRMSRQRIGVTGDLLILQAGNGRTAVGQGERIRYAHNHIVIDDVMIVLRTSQPLFDEQDLVDLVYPLLKQGQHLALSQMQFIQLRLYPVQAVLLVVFILGVTYIVVTH